MEASKVATAKNFLSAVYVTGTTYFDKCFLFDVITADIIFYISLWLS